MKPLRAALAVALALPLLGCGKSEFQRAKERYEFIQAHGATDEELCEEGRKVVSAAADAQSSEYETLKLTNDIKCRSARLGL